MVEINTLCIEHHGFYGIYFKLPSYPLHIILSSRTLLAPDCLSLRYFDKNKRRCAVLLSDAEGSYEALLQGGIIACNHKARQAGVQIGMKGKEALLLCEASQNQGL